jgi:hypothetical protein
MNHPLSDELAALLSRLRREHDILPFLEQMLPVADVRLAPLPAPMMEQLRTSPDFTSIRPGEPVWLALAAPDNPAAELVLYRAEADGRHYVIAPARD